MSTSKPARSAKPSSAGRRTPSSSARPSASPSPASLSTASTSRRSPARPTSPISAPSPSTSTSTCKPTSPSSASSAAGRRLSRREPNSRRAAPLPRSGAVIFAAGGMAAPRYLGVPGEDLPHVHHVPSDPHRYFRTRLVIVGGRNTAVEAALCASRTGGRRRRRLPPRNSTRPSSNATFTPRSRGSSRSARSPTIRKRSSPRSPPPRSCWPPAPAAGDAPCAVARRFRPPGHRLHR